MSYPDGRAQQIAIAGGRTTRAALVREQAERAHAENCRWRAFSSLVEAGTAVAYAEQLDRERGCKLGSPLDGLTLSVKGCIPVAGQRFTEGSRVFTDRVADRSAVAVRILQEAGTVFLGMTTLSELAMYAPDNPFEPLAINPLSAGRTPGGSSSGGGVAAATGMAVINLGTDSGGSIRNPAAHCGVVGFKPSVGRWPYEGVSNYTPSLSTLGAITRSVADVIATDQVLAPDRRRDAPKDLTLLVPERLIGGYCSETTRALFDAACGRLRAAGLRMASFDEPRWEAGESAAGLVLLSEAARHTATLDETLMAPALARRLRFGRGLAAEQVAEAHAAMAALRSALLRLPDDAIMMTPTWPFRAPYIYQTKVIVRGRSVPMESYRNVFVRAANAADAPAISLLAGVYPGGVPFELQIMTPQGRDGALLSAAVRIEAALEGASACP